MCYLERSKYKDIKKEKWLSQTGTPYLITIILIKREGLALPFNGFCGHNLLILIKKFQKIRFLNKF